MGLMSKLKAISSKYFLDWQNMQILISKLSLKFSHSLLKIQILCISGDPPLSNELWSQFSDKEYKNMPIFQQTTL